jgi:hypothetical protein
MKNRATTTESFVMGNPTAIGAPHSLYKGFYLVLATFAKPKFGKLWQP